MTEGADNQTLERYERRAPGWQIRCLKCGFTEPWGKYGIRIGAAGREYTLGRCARCRRICCHVIEKQHADN
jgi:hypothetical protein